MKPGYLTTEFWLTILTLLLSGLIQSGLIGDGTQLVKACAFAASTLTTIAYAISRAKVKAPTPIPGQVLELETKVTSEAGFAHREIVFFIAMLGLVACSWLKSETKATAATVVDCASAQAKDLTEQLAPTFEQVLDRATGGDGKIDWPSVDDATSRLKATAWCALENTVARLLSRVPMPGAPQSSPLEQNPDELRAGLAELRAKRFAGVTFKTTPTGD
jgi:hypothetical protein